MMKEACSFMSVNLHQATGCHIPETEYQFFISLFTSNSLLTELLTFTKPLKFWG